ncbi:hypothetical protein JW868_01965 [Candidatus Woesearchaeota archaeon]|nr:hypothetical protein [Candidatus Woesearchaeota archaeon]
MDTRMYMCSNCKRKFPSSEIRYDLDGKHLVCLECRKYPKIDKNLKPGGRQPIVIDRQKMVQASQPRGDRVMYQCQRCKYNFSIKLGSKKALRCPYCAGTDIIDMRDSTDAQKILDEVSESRRPY